MKGYSIASIGPTNSIQIKTISMESLIWDRLFFPGRGNSMLQAGSPWNSKANSMLSKENNNVTPKIN